MKNKVTFIAIMICLTAAGGLYAAPLVIANPSFEATDVNARSFLNTSPSVGAVYEDFFKWGLSQEAALQWTIVSPTPSATLCNAGLSTKYATLSKTQPNGIQCLYSRLYPLSVDPNYNNIRITSAALVDTAVAGQEYTLEFFARNQQYWGCDADITAKLFIGGVQKAEYLIHYPAGYPVAKAASDKYGEMPWKKYRLPRYTASGGDAGQTITIEFYGVGGTASPVADGNFPQKWTQFNIDMVTLNAELATLVKAKDPVPVNGQVNTGLLGQLAWTAPVGGFTKNVYFGTNSLSLPLVYTGSTASYTIPTPALSMQYETTYYWRVDEGANTGDVWSFNTGKAICTKYMSGDINGDCRVNFADFAKMAQNWLVCTRANALCP